VAVLGLNRNFVYSIKSVVPKKNIVQSFHEIVVSLFLRMKVCTAENQRLIELRDWLLPMLMNGQVTVKGDEAGTA
jgi:type I restriction enzyme S subunit